MLRGEGGHAAQHERLRPAARRHRHRLGRAARRRALSTPAAAARLGEVGAGARRVYALLDLRARCHQQAWHLQRREAPAAR